ncbi:2-dehydropantoate 2-reductase [Clostridium acetobutylicum]|uniref:2-dehydropantoate 2-reductase n=1 Tax=Clostridium acetobutylicum (strain ATCC 824 / DSM 792 / JCM 1419 / IAM 19013 / LMG 5710 / NBRC 13948 / NRRL B-527 / VKM B-1787 / 2291 / W) TaxID=272562 RepID=Q97IN5_CLOAB|nr:MULTISPECIES: 2-dehydropantoate 2-reductase [Clostridium]AAK79572.1 Ketopantoate reductase [Clostridium acetobutylicum ATCC 824]ADZ20657.1 Ketopantoate reductase [Clostridium acetobutylicum EA 2018]AEI33853.1 ketopantoate reductase [Clostridium acetobutylicum DSM 1731]AWV79988.1 2-dehydropantoate 2-reductase [Clostridium acetobutylicum]MBC2394025.1 2-dehydropantoate 2-reductase [Clostridium acetobutylicum]
MKRIRNISVVGMGAVGCAYGRKLYKLNPNNFKIIADDKRKEKLTKNGFLINGEKYDFKCVSPNENLGKDDLIIIAVKYNQLEEAIEEIRNYVGENTIILSFLNGIKSEEEIGKVYGMDKILYSYCVLESTRKGSEVYVSDGYKIVFGQKESDNKYEKIKAVRELFDDAEIDYEIPVDIIHSMWSKFMFNVGINPVSAILKANYGMLQKNKYARETMVSAMMEVINISQKASVNLKIEEINHWLAVLDECELHGKTSMCQDILMGRKTEIDMLSGEVCALGEKYGVDTPVNRTLFNMVKSIE